MGVGGKVARKAVFLDRDGVINDAIVRDGKPYPPEQIRDVKLLFYVEEGILQLRDAGYLIIVVTNQPDVARGTVSQEKVDEIHKHLKEILGIDEVFCCFHDDKDDCKCRKPRPGMILDAAAKWNVDLDTSYMVGDRWKDIEAAKAAVVHSILIDYNYDEKKAAADYVCSNFKEVTEYILNNDKRHL